MEICRCIRYNKDYVFLESCDEMKHILRNRVLLFGSTVGLGLLSCALHQTMTAQYTDSKGLLIAGNLPGRLLLLIGAVMALVLWRMVRSIGGTGSYRDNFPPCIFAGLLATAGGALMLTVVGPMAFAQPWQHWLGLAAGAAMILTGVLRMCGKRPVWLLHGTVCLFFICVLVMKNYQRWSADPQLHDYAYPLLSGVLLMLAAFHRTCCDAGLIQRRKLIVTGLGAAFCALASMYDPLMPRFYLASALWALGSVCNVAVFPPDPEPEDEPEEEAPEAGEV